MEPQVLGEGEWEKKGVMMLHVVLELKELRTLPHPGIHPVAPQTPNAEEGCMNWQRSGRAGVGGRWDGSEVTVAQPCPGPVLGGKTHTGSEDLPEPSPGACLL